MLALYQDDHYYDHQGAGGYESYDAQASALKRTFARFLRRLEGMGLTGGRLLEVGCGHGYLLEEAVPYFKLRHGTEFSAGAARKAAARADQVFIGGADQIKADSPYDTVIANHVIEHVFEPHEFMREIVDLLRPGGAVILSTPDMGGWWRLGMGKRWPSFKIPEHLLYFDAKSLTRLLRETGFSQIRKVPYPHAFPFSLVASKFGLKAPAGLGARTVWVPGTTLALAAIRGS